MMSLNSIVIKGASDLLLITEKGVITLKYNTDLAAKLGRDALDNTANAFKFIVDSSATTLKTKDGALDAAFGIKGLFEKFIESRDGKSWAEIGAQFVVCDLVVGGGLGVAASPWVSPVGGVLVGEASSQACVLIADRYIFNHSKSDQTQAATVVFNENNVSSVAYKTITKNNKGGYNSDAIAYDKDTGKILSGVNSQFDGASKTTYTIRNNKLQATEIFDVYTVQPNDTLSQLEAKNGLAEGTLQKFNPQIINQNKIFAGEDIYIPKAVLDNGQSSAPSGVTVSIDKFYIGDRYGEAGMDLGMVSTVTGLPVNYLKAINPGLNEFSCYAPNTQINLVPSITNTALTYNIFAEADRIISNRLNSGLTTDTFSNLFTSVGSTWLIQPNVPATAPYNPGMGPGYNPYGPSINPIGAFYESVSPAADTAASIADKTPVLLDANNHGLTVAQLAARDTNNDGQLTGAELNNMSAWTDLNQNGLLDAGELTTLANASITALNAARGDYTFYTQGNGQPGAGVAATPTINQSAPTLTVPASNYRSLRDTGNHRTIATGPEYTLLYLPFGGAVSVPTGRTIETQWIDWSANQIKQSNDNTALIGTDGADTFDASYYSATSWLPSSGLVNFMAGGGDDLMGGSTRSDNLWGGTGNDVLFGYAGDDKLYGEDGDDQLQGGEGADSLAGGVGNDALLGQAGNDILVGNEGNDKLFGQVGNDQLWGGDGDDVLVGFTASNEAKQSLATGETDNDTLIGGAGNDYLLGGLGDDQLDGGSGQDEITGDAGHDRIVAGSEDDRVFGGVGDDQIWGGDGNDVLVGFTASNDAQQTLNAGETDHDKIYAGAGNDLILGGWGDDQIYGEDGDDTYMVNSVNDSIVEGRNEGYDTVISSTNYQLNQNIEELRLLEGYNIHGTGNALNNKIMGNSADNILDGITGADTLMGGLGNDTYMVNSVNDSIVEGRNEGYDRVISNTNYQLNQNIEELRLLEGYNIHGTGNALNNKIMGNSADNILDGITGADTLMGGLGNDTYYVDNAGDQIIENANEGTDTVQASISTTLGANLENLNLLDFSKPELGRVTGTDGVAVDSLVYGYPKRFELDYLQGDEVDGFQGTCALTSIANLLTLSGKPTTEGEVVRQAHDREWRMAA
jgi:Ca2+-binding RTX toxin-like protein